MGIDQAATPFTEFGRWPEARRLVELGQLLCAASVRSAFQNEQDVARGLGRNAPRAPRPPLALGFAVLKQALILAVRIFRRDALGFPPKCVILGVAPQ